MTCDDSNAQAPFTLSVDFAGRLIRYKFSSVWDLDTYQRYKQAALTEMRKFKATSTPFDMLGDLTEHPPQPQFLNHEREEMVRLTGDMGLRKCAIIVSSAISRLQLSRLTSDSYAFFSSEADAMAWLRE